MDAWDVLYANGGSTNKDAWDLLHSVHVVENNSPIYVKIEDKTSATVTVSENAKVVTVKGGSTPHISVSYTGGRGPIWLPGNTYDGTSLAAILAGYIGKAQLAQDLLADIDSTITGLVDARAELASAIQANIENGTRIDDVVSRITQAEGTLELSVAKLNAAEANISNAQVFIDDASVRLSAAEGSISNASNYIATQETILSNEWTVKIQENNDGTACVAGTGLLVYPTWKLDSVYDVDDYSWFDDNAYKAIIAHTASEENVPPNSSYWQLIPYATKSQFGVLAESFFVQTSTGNKAIPFIVQGDIVYVNGDMIVNGLIQTGALSTNNIFTWSVQSHDYISGVSGYKLDATTGLAEFNNITLELNHNIIGPNIVPNSELLDISQTDWDIYYNPTNAIENSDFFIGYNLVDSFCTGCNMWRLQFANAFTLHRVYNTPCAGNYFEILLHDYIEIEPDTKYAFYAYVFLIRTKCQVDLLIYDSTHTIIERINGNVVSETLSAGALSLDAWSKSGALFTSHASARYCKFCIRSGEYTSAIAGDLWTEVSYLYLSKVNDSITELPSWVSNTQDEYTAVTQRAIDTTLTTEKGGIIVRDGGQRRYAHLTGGDLTFYDYVNSAWTPYKSVTKTVTGTCSDGETVNIGYFREQPTVIVSPYNIQSYAAGYTSQSQTFRLGAENLRKLGNDWFFNAIARLNLSSGVTVQIGGSDTQLLPNSTGSGALAATIITGATVSVSVIPPSITMPPNTRQVSVSLRVRQQYSFSYVNFKYQVPVAVNIEIQYLSGGVWVTGSTATLTGVNCLSIVERNASLSFSLSTSIESIRIVATFISYSGSLATSLDMDTPIYNTMFAEILQVTSQQEASVISASGYASYMAIG